MYQLFTLYKRKTTKKKHFIYYCQFRSSSGKRLTAISTGKTTKAEAIKWAIDQISDNQFLIKKAPFFSDYSNNWFIWDKCNYIERKLERGNYSKSYAELQLGLLKHHILPYFKNKRLNELQMNDIDHWLLNLKKRTSVFVANRSLSVLKVMLSEAVRLSIISSSPAENIESFPELMQEKGIISADEIICLFGESAMNFVWNNNYFHRTLNALAFTTGIRMGEIQALRWKDIKNEYISIEHSWDRKYGLKEPKANSKRIVPLANIISHWLDNIRDNNKDEFYIFHGNSFNKPIDHKAIVKHFYIALKNIGISEEQRKKRNLSFHSWRHTFNSIMRGKLTDIDLRRITGHKTDKMTDHYDHITIELMKRVKPLIEDTILPRLENQSK